ncbi:hypothetical protein HJG54_19255 [Leptolyngbya sp. NK1-12]|uniref:Uncharacterized protein n=1 Tax=Leptolyngbya sp. NK1-12 TaxID=2547451 RepID=A0AA96WGD2_9CYAN|nr:hypothetical protein [Leptolyngbya sp. NK1-12]WNZ24769.1 hypothetical protein HJG54_19255 [Leptolyngbya sp. NK1-12]
MIFSAVLQSVSAFESTLPTAPTHDPTLIASSQGRGTLRVINGTGQDAAVKLVDSRTGKTRHFVRIGSGDEITIRGISPCSCILKATTGTNWDQRAGRFLQNRAFFQFNDRLEFRETRTHNGVEWSNYTATLHPVAEGRAITTPISESSF